MVVNQLRISSNIIDAETEISLEETSELLQETLEQHRQRKPENDQNEDRSVPNVRRTLVPPNDFRQLSIFPDAENDLRTTEKPFLREHVIKGGYANVDDYLDTLFRLEREDFVRPLRNGIKEYLDMHFEDEAGAAGRLRRRLNDIRVYHDVCVLNPVCTQNGISYRVRFDIDRLRHVNWRYSKRLIYGSLLCLSSDEFATIHIATVANRDPQKLLDGLLEIHFETNAGRDRRGHNVVEFKPDERFLMVETSAYFEAYRHVLKSLQLTQQADLPFVGNIVMCERDVQPPQYLLTADEPTFDLTAISRNAWSPNEHDDSDDDADQFFIRRTNSPLASVPILDHSRWPAPAKFHLDDSQLRALKAALTRRLAIIQGPPGTGKTYVGLKIVQALLANTDKWKSFDVDELGSPILVVCYTNHALDQFLEGMCRFLKNGIVRVGGRSKSKKMEQFLLKEQRKQIRANRVLPRRFLLDRIDAYSELELWQTKIERESALIEGTERGLLHEEVLRDFMGFDQYEYLTNNIVMDNDLRQFEMFSGRTSQYGNSVLPVWLGLSEVIDNDAGQQVAEQAADNGLPAADEQEVADLDNEAQAAEAERVLDIGDEDDEAAAQRRQEEEQRQRRNAERADEQLAVNFENIQLLNAGGGGGEWMEPRSARRRRIRRLNQRLQSIDTFTDDEVQRVDDDVWRLSVDDRWKLYRYWVGRYVKHVRENILDFERSFDIAANRLKEILQEEDMQVMRRMKVIGMTTTGAARYINILRRIRPKIIVVEEAAEVLEAHIISTLSGGCEHMILIGDHQQLRPNPQVHDLAENYNLKYSLFERLVINNLSHETLHRQHRMRPEIANIIRLFYSELQDDDSVLHLDRIKGVAQNLYFVNHGFDERRDDELKSVSNDHEARWLVAFGNYLVQQGYSTSQITILTPYVGQLFLLKRLMRNQPVLDGMRVCPVDNFQGEENDIILMSLVRSNYDKKIGFLKDDNRICVALSRAKQGLFVIGNFDQLGNCSETWSKIIRKVKDVGAFGQSLRLCCQNHPNQAQIEARVAEDFNKAPEGGCLRQCDYRLPCGHACDRICHPYDRDHTQYKCRKPCTKPVCSNGHACPKLCCETCPPCQRLASIQLACGHNQMVPCSTRPDDFLCKAPCDRTLRCGHRCRNVCSEECTAECLEDMFKSCTQKHRFIIKCFQRNEVIQCKNPCKFQLDCQHRCSGTCGTCFFGRLHAACSSECGRTLVCGHQCDEPCTKSCPPCRRQCENRCFHSRCPRSCGRPCEPCRERCMWQCQHHQCTKLCHEPCNRPRCNQPCPQQLPCGHPCIGLCGEKCPSKCLVCHRDEVTEIFFGNEDEPGARFVQLEDCGHVFEVASMDEWMDAVVNPTAAREIQLKQCPRCKVTIRRNLRYGTIINTVLQDIEQIKLRKIGNGGANKIKVVRLLNTLESRKPEDDFAKFYTGRLKIVGLSEEELVCIENIVNFSEHITKLLSEIRNQCREMPREAASAKIGLIKLSKEVESIKTWLGVQRILLTNQELREGSMEITRLDLLFEYYQLEAKVNASSHPLLNSDKKRSFSEMLKKLADSQMTQQLEEFARDVLKETKQCMTGLGVTETERLQIVKALALGQGHWFKCPNGHYYVIEDCGGAVVEAKCGMCNAKIGGTGHRLLGDNRFAPEVDGATSTAWPGMAGNP